MSQFIDLTGQKFGRLTVVRFAGRSRHRLSLWECSCECGKTTTVTSGNLRQGISKSCGCGREVSHLKHGYARAKGPKRTEYEIWGSMIKRCENPNHVAYKNYGGRGISVCERWRYGEAGKTGFECFLEDMGTRPSPDLTVDRENNDGNYEPGNCRWATWSQQVRNRRNHKSPS